MAKMFYPFGYLQLRKRRLCQ